jgi:hypothetical protein
MTNYGSKMGEGVVRVKIFSELLYELPGEGRRY